MTTRELTAAGITDPGLRAAYRYCRRLNAAHGRTYFLATRLLTPCRRPAVHALYGFARRADDIVDDLAGVPSDVPAGVPADAATRGHGDGPASPGTGTAADRARALTRLDTDLRQALRGGTSRDPVVTAVADTARRHRVPERHFADFLRSMRMDLTVTGYRTMADLQVYMHGSAAVIGLQVLPVLGTVCPRAEAEPHAAALGVAFQLTNFLRDVGEDLDRGRVYLPEEVLAAHGADRALLTWCRRRGRTDPRIRAAVRELCATTRAVYRQAAEGVPLLQPVSRPCVATALVLYRGILDEIEAADCAVLHRRAVVPRRRRAAVALRGLTAVAAARARHRAAAPRPAAPPRGDVPPRPTEASR